MNKVFDENRRKFLKSAMGLTAGALLTANFGCIASAVAETTEEKVPFAWKPSAPPCKLIKETTAADAAEGTRSFRFDTDGRACTQFITFDIVGKEERVENVMYDDNFNSGCNGGQQGVVRMCVGRPASEIIACIKGIVCRNKRSGSSCPDQLALGLEQALMIIHGNPCPGCESGVCVNTK